MCQLRAKFPEKAASYQTDDVSRLEKVFKRHFSLIAPALKNLRTGNEARSEEQIEKTEQGQICITNTEVQESREKRRKKEAKSTPINSTSPFGVPEPILPIDSQDMRQYIAREQE